MALIKCPECNKEISDKVKTCPYCGYPLKGDNNKKIKIILIAIGVIVCICILIFGIYRIQQERILKEEQRIEAEKEATKRKAEEECISVIATGADNAYDACEIILSVWQEAGVHRDFNLVFKYMFSGDIIGHEWSGLGMDKDGFAAISWGTLANDMNEFSTTLDNLKSEKIKVDEALEACKESESENMSIIVEYYNCYLNLYNAAIEPSGNRINYSSNLVSNKNSLDNAWTKVNMLGK